MPVIELKNISKTYYIGENVPVPALDEVSLKVEPGEFVAIMGSSGSGKSTLLAILGLLDKADKGQYFLLNNNVTGLQEKDYAVFRNKFFGFIFQMFNLLSTVNVVDNTTLPFIYSSEITQEKKKHALEILKKVGLSDRLDHKPNQLSGGQQQRVAIARALANDPLLILADEPTGNLDSKSSNEIMNILKELHQQGKTIIMVTHEDDIAAAASRVITLHDGKIIKDEVRAATKKTELPKIELKKKKTNLTGLLSSIRNYCYEAYVSIANNKLRSFLSILGVMIGVAAVIAMLALGAGAKRNMEETLSALGNNVLMVRNPFRSTRSALGIDERINFTFDDLKAMEKIETIKYVIPYVNGNGQIIYGNKNWSTSLVGTSTNYPNLKEKIPEKGRFFNQAEENSRAKVVVLGKTVADELFGDEDPIGKWIKLNRSSFNIVGVMPKQGAMGWRDMDNQVLLPIKTAMYRLLGENYISYFEVKVDDSQDIPYAQEQIISEILRVHNIPESQKERVYIMNMEEIQQAANAMIQTLAYLLGAVAAVSLLVGGIGIMNIMLVMVMERTHEIGLRKALGAQKGDIMLQFLIESVLICLFGGVIGILFGIFISWILSTFAGWVIYVSSYSIILAFTFALLVGIVFGLWPAWRASKLEPIVALRYE